MSDLVSCHGSRFGGNSESLGTALELALEVREVRIHHHPDQFRETDGGLPAKHAPGFAGIGSQIDTPQRDESTGSRSRRDRASPTPHARRRLRRIPAPMGFAGADDVIVGSVLLQHEPHRLT